MIAILLFVVGILFLWKAFKGLASREIEGRGWGFSTRIYRRDYEPVFYWITVSSYVVIFIWTTVFVVMAAIGYQVR